MNPTSNHTFTKIKKIVIIFSFLFAASVAKAQVTVTEGFDNNFAGTTFPNEELPFGWTQSRVAPSNDPANFWQRVNAANGTNPPCTPHGGSISMMRFRSFYVNTAGEQGYIVSRPFDLTLRGAATSNLSFWMYRDNVYGANENITVKINTSPNPSGATTLVENTQLVSQIQRNCNAAPAGTCNAWNQYTWQIPPGAGWNVNNLYVFIYVWDGGANGGNIYIDDFSIQTYPGPMTFNSLSLDFQNTNEVAKPSANNWIIGLNVEVTNAGSPLALGPFTFTHNGSTNPGTDITANSAKLWWTGGTNTFSTTNAVLLGTYSGAFPVANFSITPTAAAITVMGGGLHSGNNYLWLTYDIPAGATSGNYVDADFISASLGGIVQMCGGIGCSKAGARQIAIAYCIPAYSVGTSGLNGSYTSNDYIKSVSVTNVGATDPLFIPFYNDHNDNGPLVAGAGYPSDPCVTSSTFIINNGGLSPFTAHPSDYEKFPIATVPRLCSAGNCTRTASFLSIPVSPPVYNIEVQCGSWYGSNVISAFIDFNHDGSFANNMWNTPGGEKIIQTTNMNALTFQNANFQIPTVGVGLPYYGQTTLRVREWYASFYAPNYTDPCSAGYYGEVEDYTVSIRPPCNPAGWDVWLGFSDDWNTPANWCAGVPTSTDNVLIPGTGGSNYFHPVIKSSVVAAANKLVIQNDTLEINAPVAGSLSVNDSVVIGTNSLIKVQGEVSDTAILGNGVNVSTTFSLFRQSFREQKVQLMYKTNELLSQGLLDGDLIDKIIIPIRVRRSTLPYPVTISYYYGQNGGAYPNFVNVGYSSPVPAAPANCLAFGAPSNGVSTPVFSGAISFGAIPVNGSGNHTLTLTTPIPFLTAGNYPLIIEICYSVPVTSSNDDMWQTQTVGYRSVLLLANLGAYAPPACAWTNGAPNGTNVTQRLTTDLRPNLHFVFHRVYDEFPINVKGHWKNTGSFIAGKSDVTFNGTALQHLRGTVSTTFNNLTINNNAGVKIMTSPKVNGILDLNAGKLDLNAKSISILNPAPGAIVRTSGAIQSETTPPNYGTVEWTIGSTTGSHVFPFRTAGNTYIPLTYNLVSGNVGTVKAATYPTPANNLPYPTGVTNVNDTNNVDNSAFTVDRFWHLNKTGPSGTARIKFTYRNSEAPSPIVNGNIRAHSYAFSNNKWQILTNNMTNTINSPSPSTSEVFVFGVSGNSLNATEWALADASSPLRLGNSFAGEFDVSPNPFSDKIVVSSNLNYDKGENISLALYNILGEKVSDIAVPANLLSENERFEWSPGEIKNGVYFLIIQTKNEVRTERVIKMGE